MEHGFFHPDRGYWQTTGMPTSGTRASYPEGTIEVPLKPGPDHDWVDGAWVAQPLPAPTEAEVRAEAARRLGLMASAYSAAERETWAVQLAEAQRVLADPAAPAPMLSAIAAARGLDLTTMAQLVIDRAEAHATAAGAILAAQSALIAADPIPADFADDAHWPPAAT